MKKIEQGTWITLAMIAITATTSHVKLDGKINMLMATNAIEHKYLKEKIDGKTMPVIVATNHKTPNDPPKRKKKIYAQTED